MRGISRATIPSDTMDGPECRRLSGDVRLENNGGFLQAAPDLHPSGKSLDAAAYTGVRPVVCGNGERYSVHLRTPDHGTASNHPRCHAKTGRMVWGRFCLTPLQLA